MTNEEFWRNTHGAEVRWRTARRDHYCGHCRERTIQPGDRYFDCAELIDPPFSTAKLCATHAREEVR